MIQKSTHQEGITILNVCAPNKRAVKHMQFKNTEMKGNPVKPWITSNLFCEGSARRANISNKLLDKQVVVTPNVTWPNWASGSSLSPLLQDCRWSSPMLRCSVSGRSVWQKSVIFQNVVRCPQLALVYFCHCKAPMDTLLLFHTRVSLGMLCFIQGHWVGSNLVKLHKKKKIPSSQ